MFGCSFEHTLILPPPPRLIFAKLTLFEIDQVVKPVLGPNCVIPYEKIFICGIVQFGPKTGLVFVFKCCYCFRYYAFISL